MKCEHCVIEKDDAHGAVFVCPQCQAVSLQCRSSKLAPQQEELIRWPSYDQCNKIYYGTGWGDNNQKNLHSFAHNIIEYALKDLRGKKE